MMIGVIAISVEAIPAAVYCTAISENTNANAILKTFRVRLPSRFEPNSLSNAVAVHENATPIDINSPKYVIVRFLCARKGTT